jgi:hypothetical protein
MDTSWNWRIVEFGTLDAIRFDALFSNTGHWNHTDALCRKKGCNQKVACNVYYDYVSGAKGRVTQNTKPYCREHAEEIVKRHAVKEATTVGS